MNYLFVSASFPPKVCGVGDYTYNLLNSIGGGMENVFTKEKWSICTLIELIKTIKNLDVNVVCLQYPSEGFGRSMFPFYFLFLSKFLNFKTVITLHEYSSFSLKARFLINVFFPLSDLVIFTNSYELDSYRNKSFSKYFGQRLEIIPIASNIPHPKTLKSVNNRNIDFVYFGLIRPNKGVEEFIKFVQKIKKSHSIDFKLIGMVPSGYEYFYNDILRIYELNEENFILNREPIEVSALLNDSRYAYLYFPDGLSTRRGSFLACLSNGCTILSNDGPFTTKELRKFFLNLENFDYTSSTSQILTFDNDEIKSISPTWDDVSYRYKVLFNEVYN